MNNFTVLLPFFFIFAMLAFVLVRLAFFNPLKKLAVALGGKLTRKGEICFPLEGRDIFVKYTPGSKNRSPEFNVYVQGTYGAQLLIRYETSLDRFYKQVGLNVEPQVSDRDVNDKLYFECDDQAFINRLFLRPEVKQQTFDLLSKYSDIEITIKTCLLKKYPSADISNISTADVTNSAKELLDFAASVPPVGDSHPELLIFKIKRGVLNLLGTLMLAAGLISWIWGGAAFHVVESMRLWTWSSNYSIPMALAIFGIVFWLIKGFSTSSKVFIYFLITFSIGTVLCGRYGAAIFNGVYDTSVFQTFDQPVIEKYITTHKSSTYYHVVVQGWRPGMSNWSFTVSSNAYNSITLGRSRYRITTRSGCLKYEWVISEKRIEDKGDY